MSLNTSGSSLSLTAGSFQGVAAFVPSRFLFSLSPQVGSLSETEATLVAVSNEVGLGVVPEYPLARLYRDQLGWANQRLAAAADRVYFLVAGFPLDVSALAASPLTPSPVKESDQ